MALFMIERNFGAALDPSAASLKAIVEINNQTGVKWLQSFLSADKRKTYCLYEAESADAIREAARRAGLPADVIIELAGELRPEVVVAPVL
jgi:Nickel responsive protein SCO4226-like